MEVGGADEWEPKHADDPLVPFGQRVLLDVRIDMADGSWSPWLQMFTGQIRENIFERPSMITTIECADPGASMEEFLHEHRKAYSNMSMVRALTLMADACLPGQIFNVERAASAEGTKTHGFVAEAGQSRLEAAVMLAGKHGHEIFWDWNGDMVVRRDLTDEDDEDWDPSTPGPDIGHAGSPVLHFRDGRHGNLLGVTATLSREQSVNGVSVNLSATVNHKKKGQKKGKPKEIFWTHSEHATGSVAFGDRFGRINLVETTPVDKLTAERKARQIQRAKKLLLRRRGLLRYLDFDALPMYWADVDDRVKITVQGSTENHYLASVTYDLAGGPMRCRTRTLAVTDPGDLG
jgi:hypothetical protein